MSRDGNANNFVAAEYATGIRAFEVSVKVAVVISGAESENAMQLSVELRKPTRFVGRMPAAGQKARGAGGKEKRAGQAHSARTAFR
jgi:hypothetical protein